jgi:hypothetical protein
VSGGAVGAGCKHGSIERLNFMPRYIIERQYLLPIYEHLLVEAPTFDAACREALDEYDHPWGNDAQQDSAGARGTTITYAVELPEPQSCHFGDDDQADRDALAHALYSAGLDPLPIPSEFTEDASDVGEKVGFS